MNIRKLQAKDAPLMLEWMHDGDVTENLQANFSAKTIDDCSAFIVWAQDTSSDMHLAVVDEADQYMGTVSLKHIADKKAEFAITIRRCAMGKGYSRYAMAEILRIGLEEIGLDMIYWCVAPENLRAVRFYDKCGYPRVNVAELTGISENYTQAQMAHYIWYAVRVV